MKIDDVPPQITIPLGEIVYFGWLKLRTTTDVRVQICKTSLKVFVLFIYIEINVIKFKFRYFPASGAGK